MRAVGSVLRAHEPWPAIVVDRRWDLVRANAAAALLVEGVAPHLLQPPVNVLRVSLHPDGLAPRIANLPAMADHLLHQLRRQRDALGDPRLTELAEELEGYPGIGGGSGEPQLAGLACTMQLRVGDATLSFLSMVATFGTAMDATLADLSLETFLPVDEATASVLRRRAA
jgi:hypothetical protein